MELETQDWKEFRIGDLFDIQGTATTKIDTLAEEYGIGEHPYITTQATNNGTAGYYNYYTENGNVLVADSAVVGYVSYQPKCFSASDHVEKLMPKFDMNKYNALFLVTILNCENCRYSYGRKFNQTNIKQTIIKLPAKSVTNETGKSIYEPDWQFMEDYIKSLRYKLPETQIQKNQSMTLDVTSWKEFNLLTICKIDMGNKLDNNKMTHYEPSINFISRTANNNGVSDVVDPIANIPPYPVNSVTVALGGSIGSCFLQTKNFYTGQNVSVLSFDEKISNYAKLFVMTIFMHECKYKYVAFGRELNVHIRKDFMLYLPSKLVGYDTKGDETTPIYEPDWQFMEDYIKSLQYELPLSKIAPNKNNALNTADWKEFRIGDLFDIQLSKGDIKEGDCNSGNIPLISSGTLYNGIVEYIDKKGDGKAQLFPQNTITVDMFCQAFYQPKNFYSVSHGRVNILSCNYPIFNKYHGLFICTAINKEKYRFSYNKAVYSGVISDLIIKLPAKSVTNETEKSVTNETGKSVYEPDWQFMEDYIKSLKCELHLSI
jgi:restriction endonuclease S subunit